MYSISNVKEEIESIISELMDSGTDRVMPEWVTQAVMAKHVAPDVEDFYVVCARAQVRKLVGEQMRGMKKDEEEGDSDQMILEGFECLQAYYMVEMQDKQLASIRIDVCSDEQLLAKAAAIGRVSKKLAKHESEIVRYVEDRRAGLGKAG